MFKNLKPPQQKAIKQELISMEFKAEKFLTYFSNGLLNSMKNGE